MSSHRKRKCYSCILLFRNFVLSSFARFVSRIPLLYYRVHFLASSSQKIQTEVKFSEPTEQQQFVRDPVVPAKGALIIYEGGGSGCITYA